MATPIVAGAPGLEAKTYAKVDRRLIPFLFLCYILAYLDRVNVGFAKLQMLSDLSLSEVAFGTGAGIFFAGYFLFEVPSNLLLKRFGARTWIARIMVSWGILSSAMMWVKSEWAFYGVRFLLGVAEAGFFPGIIFYLTLWYPSRLRSTRTAWFVSGHCRVWRARQPDLRPGHGWALRRPRPGRLAVAVSGGGTPSYLRRHLGLVLPGQQHRPGQMAGGGGESLAPRNLDAEDQHKHQFRLLDAFRSGRVYAFCFIYFTLMIGLYGISFWLPSIVKAMGVKGYLNVGLITAIPYAVAVVGMVFLSRSSDRTGERRLHYVFNVSAGALGLALSGVFSSHPVLGDRLPCDRHPRRHWLHAHLLASAFGQKGRGHGPEDGHGSNDTERANRQEDDRQSPGGCGTPRCSTPGPDCPRQIQHAWCNRRSPVRSECRLRRIMPTTATA